MSLDVTHRAAEKKLDPRIATGLSTADLRMLSDRGCRRVALALLAELVADLRAA